MCDTHRKAICCSKGRQVTVGHRKQGLIKSLPLIRQFGQAWYDEAELVYEALKYPPSTEEI